MISSVTPDILQNLKAVLSKIMINGHTKNKYIAALQDAIDEINLEESIYSSPFFDVKIADNEDGGVLIDVFTNEGTLIDTLEYCSENLISDDEAGEA